MKIRAAPRCLVCDRSIVRFRHSMCVSCAEAFDRLSRRDSTTIGIIRWAAYRARKFERQKTARGKL